MYCLTVLSRYSEVALNFMYGDFNSQSMNILKVIFIFTLWFIMNIFYIMYTMMPK